MASSPRRSIAPSSHRTTLLPALLAAGTALAVLLAALPAPTQAAHSTNAFELDRNVADGAAAGADWANVYDGSFSGFNRSFLHDEDRPDASYHATGDKDTLPIADWDCVVKENPNDKGDILHAFTAVAEGPDGDDPGTEEDAYLFFGASRFDGSGSANIGVWFLQDVVGCDPNGSGSFTGGHVDGDLLVVSEFTNGGSVPTIKVYRWDGDDATGSLDTTELADGGDCIGAASGDVACATVNNATFSTPWPEQTKTGAADTLPEGHLFEGGINLNTLFGDEVAFRCFKNAKVETRSSASLTATLLDYSLSRLKICDARITITPQSATNPVGTTHDFTIKVEENRATGWLPAEGELVTAVIDSGPGSFVGGANTCTTGADGTCVVTIQSSTAGDTVVSASTTVVSASTTVHVGQSTLDVTTDGTGSSSGPATKTWVKVAADITTQADPSGGDVAPGTAVRDDATVSTSDPDLPTPTGTVTFFLCSPSEVTAAGCESGGTQVGSPVSLDASGQATSATTTNVFEAGTWCWRAEYSGNSGTYLAGSHTNTDTECFTVPAQDAGLTTTASPQGSGVVPGSAAQDSADAPGVAGAPKPTGSVVFFLCKPSEVTAAGCESGGTQVGSPVSLDASGQATSATTTDTFDIGQHCWRAEYGGDALYAAASHTNADTECFTTEKQPPTITTTSDPTGDTDSGVAASDEATVSGAAGNPTPTGTVTFFL